MLAATARVAGDIDLAEECVQDAYVSALDAWTRDGVPSNPGAWLTVAARRKALDAHRRDRTLRAKLPLLRRTSRRLGRRRRSADADEPDVIADDRLRLVFTCCHPALAREAQVALTLRLICGLTTAEIAQAFLVSEATMAARVTRAKKKIAAARIAYRVPPAAELPDRLDAVLTVVHLLYTTGHTAPSGSRTGPGRPGRPGAFDLTRMLGQLMPDEREVRGLLALMLLTDARRGHPDRRPDGRLLLLEEQDRSRCGTTRHIEDGRTSSSARCVAVEPGRFALQAAIAALHAEAPILRRHRLADRWSASTTNCCGCGPRRSSSSTGRRCVHGVRSRPRWPRSRLEQDRRLRATVPARHEGRPAPATWPVRRGRRPYRAAYELADNAQEREFLAQRIAETTRPADSP